MSGRVSSSPNLLPLSIDVHEDHDVGLEGIATNVKLLLKLVQDHQEASNRGSIDERRTQRLGGMISIIDDVKTRLQKSQNSGKKELRRCNTDLRGSMSNPPSPRDQTQRKNEIVVLDEKEKLRKELHTSYAAQKRLGVMCASLGKEKDIIARELTRRVEEFNEMEELVTFLKIQNDKLSNKVQAYVREHKEQKKSGQGCSEAHEATLQQRNKELSEQLVKCLEGYKSLKKRLKEEKDARHGIYTAMDAIGEDVEASIHGIHSLKESICACSLGDQEGDIDTEISAMETAFKRVQAKVSRYRHHGRQ